MKKKITIPLLKKLRTLEKKIILTGWIFYV